MVPTLPLDPCSVPLPQPATEVYLNHDIMHHIFGLITAHLVIPSTSKRQDQPSPTFYRRVVKRDCAPQTLGMVRILAQTSHRVPAY